MRYEKCLTCPELGKTCDGPNFMAMETQELGEWCKAKLQQRQGITYDRVASETGVSKSTVYGFLNGSHTDYRLDTIRPILKLIIGGNWADSPCGNVNNSEKAKFEETIRQLEREIEHRDQTIAHYEKDMEELKVMSRNANSRQSASQEFLRGQIRKKDRVIYILAIALFLVVALIVAALIVDKADPTKGFFWTLSSMLKNEHIWITKSKD